jgi:hypothetical protein
MTQKEFMNQHWWVTNAIYIFLNGELYTKIYLKTGKLTFS